MPMPAAGALPNGGMSLAMGATKIYHPSVRNPVRNFLIEPIVGESTIWWTPRSENDAMVMHYRCFATKTMPL